MSLEPNAHSFTSSSVMTYSKKGDEPPKVFQASAQMRTAPGGVNFIPISSKTFCVLHIDV